MPAIIERGEVQRLLSEDGGQLIEVLPEKEYEVEHIAGALNIPLKQLDAEGARQLDRARPVITYCHDYL